MDPGCWCKNGPCAFHLGYDDIKNFTVTLPRLETLELGRPCCSGACNTTVASLMLLSTHCLQLTLLEIHFNTLMIARDMQLLLGRGLGYDTPRCKLRVV